MDNKNKISSIQILLAITGILLILWGVSFSLANDVFAQTNSSEGQPNINAESIFNTKTMILGNNIQNLVILIPNEGHHAAGEDNEARFLDQHFVPENAIVEHAWITECECWRCLTINNFSGVKYRITTTIFNLYSAFVTCITIKPFYGSSCVNYCIFCDKVLV